MSRSVFLVLAVVALALSPATARAAWGPDSVLTLGQGGNIPFEWGAILPEGGGDLYAIWHSPRSSGVESQVSRVTREGRLVFSIGQEDRTPPPGVAVDGSDGVFEAFTVQRNPSNPNPDIAFRRTTPAGEPQPPFGTTLGYSAHQTTSLWEELPAAATDLGGGAYIAWLRATGPCVQRVTAAGTIAPGWGSLGRKMGPDWYGPPYAAPALLPDGNGGVFMLTAEDFVRLWRVQPDTTLASGWPEAGVPLSTVSNSYAGEVDPALVAGPRGHAFAAWLEHPNSTHAHVVVRSFDDAGNLDGPVLGLSTFSRDISKLAAQDDGQGGMLVTWLQEGTLEIAHVLANGAVAAWALPVSAGTSGWAVAAGRNGGFLAFWGDIAGLWVRWYLADGSPDPNEPVNPRLVLAHGSASLGVYPLAACPDGDGGAYLLFGNGGNPGPTRAQMMHVFPSKVVNAGVRQVRPRPAGPPAPGSGLVLAVAQNPARRELRLGVTLLGEQAATIDLLDVAGRRWLTRTVPAGASVSEERIALPSGLPPGVYLVSLRQGSRAATRRVAIIQ
jgi:hypothetical protein